MEKAIKYTVGIVLLISSLISSSIFAQNHELHDEKLVGKVKTLTRYTYQSMSGNTKISPDYLTSTSVQKYNEDGRIMEFIRYRRTGSIEYIDSYIYNARGLLISDQSVNHYEPNDSRKEEMVYDTAGNEIEIRIYDASNDQKSLSRFKYEGKNVIEEDIYNGQTQTPSIRILYTYDAKGHNIAFKLYKEKDSLEVSNSYFFDSKGHQVRYINRDGNNKIIETGSNVYKYYPNGAKLEETSLVNGKQSFKSVYDKRGNAIREISYSGLSQNDILSDETDRYDQIDVHGNWTIQRRYNLGVITRIDVRKIEYYR